MELKYIEVLDGCWWTGYALTDDGYVRITRKREKWLAHRYTYVNLVGPIPDGLVLDHTCRNRWCANPAHLEPVTPLENTRRGLQAGAGPGSPQLAKTHCPQGHDYSRKGNVRYKKAGKYTKRICKRCEASQAKARRTR